MDHAFSRTELIIGADALNKLKQSKVSIFGIGGVGSFVVEGLARSGIGRFVLIDHDTICVTNLNRQLHATTKTIGAPKVEIMRNRILEINPEATVTIHQQFYLPDNAETLFEEDIDYIVDAIDTVTAKIDLIIRAKEKKIPIISCMGAGNKLDPTRFEVTDIHKTSVCPLAKVMRKELKKRGLESLKVLYSKEEPIKTAESENTTNKKRIPGSISFVPSVAGLIIAGEVIKDLISNENGERKHV